MEQGSKRMSYQNKIVEFEDLLIEAIHAQEYWNIKYYSEQLVYFHTRENMNKVREGYETLGIENYTIAGVDFSDSLSDLKKLGSELSL